jgi:transcription elongation factor GreA
MMEGRIRQLTAILKDAQIAESVSDGKVGPGSVITIVYEGDSDDSAERYLVGHIEERHDDVEVITPGSPLGSALLGHCSGETVSYEASGRTLRVTIKSVEG